MREDKVYEFRDKKISLFLESLGLLLAICLAGILIVTCYRTPMLVVILGIVPAYLFYLQYYSLYMTLQFTKYDKGKKLVIDKDREYLTITQNNKTLTINNSDVERVEFYEQNHRDKFAKYYYMVIFINAQEPLLLTDFTVPLLLNDPIMAKFLRKKPRTYFKKQFNFIDEKKFKILA